RLSSPIPSSLFQQVSRQLQTSIQQRKRLLFAGRAVLQPISNHRQMKYAERIRSNVADLWNLSLHFRFGKNFAHKPQVAQIVLLRLQAQGAEFRGGLERAQIDR